MSANSLGLTLDGLPRTRMGGGGHFQSFLAAVMEAVKAGCEAEAEYRRHVAREDDGVVDRADGLERITLVHKSLF